MAPTPIWCGPVIILVATSMRRGWGWYYCTGHSSSANATLQSAWGAQHRYTTLTHVQPFASHWPRLSTKAHVGAVPCSLTLFIPSSINDYIERLDTRYGQKTTKKRFANIIFFKSNDLTDYFEWCMNCNVYKLEANVLVRRPSSKPQMFYIAVHTSRSSYTHWFNFVCVGLNMHTR